MPEESDKNTAIIRNKKGQFIPGNKEGNRKGRPPKVKCIPDILRKIGKEEVPIDGKTKLDIILYKVYRLALEGKPWAVQFIADRTEGKAVEHVKHQEVKDELIIE